MRNRLTPIVALLLLASCAAAPKVQLPIDPVAYAPVPATSRIAGSASIQATYDPAPEFINKWKKQGFKDKVIDHHRQEVINAVANDLASCGLFTRILPASGEAHPDYIVKIQCRTVQGTTYMSAQITFAVINGATSNQEWTFGRELGLGPIHGPHLPLAQTLSRIMVSLKSDLATAIVRKAKDEAERAELARMQTAPLADLLAASDRDEAIARERNHAIVAAKTQQLPDILRTWKTDELTALVVKIEQTILDLNHECEIAKDKAQQSVADGSNQATGTTTNLQNARMEAVMARGRGAPATAAVGQGFLGINMGPVVNGTGVLVESVLPGSPADQSGLIRSDAIFSADDQPMPDPQTLQNYVAKTPPGSIIKLQLIRNGAQICTSVVIGQRSNAAPNSFDTLRGLSISYRERIELLKAILSALKEEIANRNR
jgi:hypothetical protein